MPDLVWADVVLDVLFLPPTGRQPRDQRGHHHQHVVSLHRPEDLAVPGVVPQESELAERARHQGRVCHLHPQAVEYDQYGCAGDEKRERERYLDRIIAVLAVQKSALRYQTP